MRIELLIFDLDKCIFNTFSAILSSDASGPVLSSGKTYGDEHHLASIQTEKVLVTKGYERLQRQKIAAVDIKRFFSEVFIAATDDPRAYRAKISFFREIMIMRGLRPKQIMVIGDDPGSELGAGKKLGMVTVQTLRAMVSRWPEADFHINSFDELPRILEQIERGES